MDPQQTRRRTQADAEAGQLHSLAVLLFAQRRQRVAYLAYEHLSPSFDQVAHRTAGFYKQNAPPLCPLSEKRRIRHLTESLGIGAWLSPITSRPYQPQSVSQTYLYL